MTLSFCGKARAGKDVATKIFLSLFAKEGILAKRYAFADELKKELAPLFLLNAGMSPFSEDPLEKELMRPCMVAYGTGFWRKKDPDHWIKKVSAAIKNFERPHIAILADNRFPNELCWVKENGKALYLARTKEDGTEYPPANKDEEENDPFLRQNADYFLQWQNCEDNFEKLANIGEAWFYEIFGNQLEILREKYPI
jgi:hypothetical protein